MEYTEIIIDDLYQLELGDKAILIPTTYELIDIKDLNRRSGSKTKTIVIPRTKQNDKIFGFAFSINAKNAFDKYAQRKIRIQKNSQVLFNGLCRLTEVTSDTISFYAFAELSKLKDVFGEKMLTELNLDDLDHVYDETIVDTWNGTYPAGVPADYFYPVIDYGQFQTLDPLSGGESPPIKLNDLYPALYLKRAIKQICNDNGYTLSTTFFDDYNTSKLLIPFSNAQFIHSDDFLTTNFGFYGTRANTAYTIPLATGDNIIPFPITISDNLSQWSVDEYTANGNQRFEVLISVKYKTPSDTYPVGWNFVASLEQYDNALGDWRSIDSKTFPNRLNPQYGIDFSLFATGFIADTEKFRLNIVRPFATGALELYECRFIVRPKQRNADDILNIIYGETAEVAPNLPPIKQIDLFQWCYKMFNWIVFVNDNTGVVEIYTYDQYYQNNKQKDFSEKLSLTPAPIINYQPTNFSRKYDFRYKHDDKDFWSIRYDLKQTLQQPYKFGDGQYYLTKQGDASLIGEVGFSPTIIEKSFKGDSPNYIKITSMLDAAEPTIKNTQKEPRILINGGLVTIETLSDGVFNQIYVENIGYVGNLPLCYFQKQLFNETGIDSYSMNLSFSTPDIVTMMQGNLIDRYYKQAIDSLSVSAQVTAYFKLSSKDITELDFAELWYISYFSAIFRLNRIIDYNPNSLGLTKVELINVGVLDRTPQTFGAIEPVTDYTYLNTEILEDIITENNNDIII
jgi:hypothetical protein